MSKRKSSVVVVAVDGESEVGSRPGLSRAAAVRGRPRGAPELSVPPQDAGLRGEPRSSPLVDSEYEAEGDVPRHFRRPMGSELELVHDDFDVEFPAGRRRSRVSATRCRHRRRNPREAHRGRSRKRLRSRALLSRRWRPIRDGARRRARDCDRGRGPRDRHWVAILSYCPAAGMRSIRSSTTFLQRRKRGSICRRSKRSGSSSTHSPGTGQASHDHDRKYRKLCASLAKAVRLADSDRLWIARAEGVVRHLANLPSPEGLDPRGRRHEAFEHTGRNRPIADPPVWRITPGYRRCLAKLTRPPSVRGWRRTNS